MTSISSQLQALDIKLPAPREPAFSYSAIVIDGDLGWVSGQLPWLAETTTLVHTGRLGENLTLDQGKTCARACILNGLSILDSALGSLDRLQRVIKLVGYVSSGSGFHQQPAVIDAASQLLIDVFGDAGRHARSAVGVAELPRGAPVEIELVVRIKR